MKPYIFLPVLLLMPFTFQSDDNHIFKRNDIDSDQKLIAPIEISRKRADELFSKLPSTDPWIVRQDGSALAWVEAATLETLVDLYEATEDPSYFNEVARRG